MERLVRNAYAKINLGLDVTGVRPNGYHDVCMIMQTVELHDVLAFEKIAKQDIPAGKSTPYIELTVTDEELSSTTDATDNLIYKAAALLMREYNIQDGVRIELTKNIPIAAGMAGGSTDAAAAFHGVKELFDLQIDDNRLCELGVTLGADIPYCIIGGTALSEGIGEILTPLTPLASMPLVIVKPDLSVSTKMVYQALDSKEIEKHPDIWGMKKAIEDGDQTGIISRLGNVLEDVTVELYPEIDHIKQMLVEAGALGALMSGSGPTVFGIFADPESADKACRIMKDKTGYRQVMASCTWNE